MVDEIKRFEIAAKKPATDTKPDEGLKFEVPNLMPKPKPGEEPKEQTYTTLVAYQPDEAQFAMLMASVGRGASDADRIAGIINFFVNILDEDGADYLQGRLLTPTRIDPFGIDEVEQIMDWLAGEWTGNPTSGPSGSTPSPLTDSPKSTEPTPLLTS